MSWVIVLVTLAQLVEVLQGAAGFMSWQVSWHQVCCCLLCGWVSDAVPTSLAVFSGGDAPVPGCCCKGRASKAGGVVPAGQQLV